jgi:hypothetical protein
MDPKAAPLLLRYGGAKKSSFEMSPEELEQAAISILLRAQEKSFSKGQPIFFSKQGKVLAQFPDGRIEEVKKDT